MKRKLYGNSIPPCCEYCSRARRNADGKTMLCIRRGIVPMYHHCRRFRYDPLMRIPARQPVLGQYTEEDFRL
ncbi:MAG: hypothetical protein IJN07_01105 [Clostridia bacterium]|nr:hypothetical protein [Clostridia bacterium]